MGTKLENEAIVKAFDECLDYVFGRSLGRDNPHKSDMETASRWVDEGLTPVIAAIVFHEQMSWMHEKFLRYGGAKDRSYLPASLKVFDDNIMAAVRRVNTGGVTDIWESELSRWRSRCKGWLKNNKLWNYEQWGKQPSEANNRVPVSVLKELKIGVT